MQVICIKQDYISFKFLKVGEIYNVCQENDNQYHIEDIGWFYKSNFMNLNTFREFQINNILDE